MSHIRYSIRPPTDNVQDAPSGSLERYKVKIVSTTGSTFTCSLKVPTSSGWRDSPRMIYDVRKFPDDSTTYLPGATVWIESYFGSWFFVQSGGGSVAPRIRFTIISAAFNIGYGAVSCDHVVGLVNHISCSGTGVSVGDEVNIYDPEYCYFNLPIELLVGLSGTATMMNSDNYQHGLDYLLDCVAQIHAHGCIWMIDTLCCAEEEYI